MSNNIKTFLVASAVAAASMIGLNSQASAAISQSFPDQNAPRNWSVIAPVVPESNAAVSITKSPLIRVAPRCTCRSASISRSFDDQNALENQSIIAPAVPEGNADGISSTKAPLVRVAPNGNPWRSHKASAEGKDDGVSITKSPLIRVAPSGDPWRSQGTRRNG